MKQELTLKEMKEFKPSEEQIKATEQVFLYMAEVDIIKPIVEGYQKEILLNHKFHISKKNIRRGDIDRIILNPEHTYLMEDLDFKIYLQEVAEQHIKHGFKVKKDYCPLLIAQANLSDSQNKLIVVMESLTGIKRENVYIMDLRAKYLNLLLGLMSKYVNKEQALNHYEGQIKKELV